VKIGRIGVKTRWTKALGEAKDRCLWGLEQQYRGELTMLGGALSDDRVVFTEIGFGK
jgi:hypothetical protein